MCHRARCDELKYKSSGFLFSVPGVYSADLTALVDTVCVSKLASEFHTDVLLLLFVALLCESPTAKEWAKV